MTTPISNPTHDVTCSECGTLFACACSDLEVIMHTTRHEHIAGKHKRYAERGTTDPCPDCRRKAMEAWVKWRDDPNYIPETYGGHGENENQSDPWTERR